jgi:hypothetical protein
MRSISTPPEISVRKNGGADNNRCEDDGSVHRVLMRIRRNIRSKGEHLFVSVCRDGVLTGGRRYDLGVYGMAPDQAIQIERGESKFQQLLKVVNLD